MLGMRSFDQSYPVFFNTTLSKEIRLEHHAAAETAVTRALLDGRRADKTAVPDDPSWTAVPDDDDDASARP